MLSIPVAALVIALGGGVADAAAPANDNLAAATPLAVGQEISGSNVDATAQSGEPDPTGPSYSWSCTSVAGGPQCASSVWYSFQPASSGEYTIETCDLGTELNTTLAVYTVGKVLSLVKENNNETGCPGGPYDSDEGSRLTFAAVGGTLYHVYLGGYRGDEGSYWLRTFSGKVAQPRPTPDTGISSERSAALQLHGFHIGQPTTSGLRHTPSLAMETTPPELPLECSLDGGAFSPCGPAVSYDDLAPGSSHILQARAVSGGTIDPTPLVHRFTIDATPPETAILSGPSGPSPSQEAAWAVASNELSKQPISLVCGIDSMPFSACGETPKYTGLCQGHHAFSVAAVDVAHNADPSPAGAQVDVTTGPTCTAPTVEPLVSNPSTLPTQLVSPSQYDTKGAGGLLRIQWGKTTSYGTEFAYGVPPSASPGNAKVTIPRLDPSTTYHYRVTLTTPFGTASSPDQTATTDAPEKPLAAIQNGTPVVAGRYAASVPLTVDFHGQGGDYSLQLAAGEPISETNSARFFTEDSVSEGLGPVGRTIAVADLDPATTYHYRFTARAFGGSNDEVVGPESTFTTPPFAILPISGKVLKRFKLRKGQVKIGKLTRKSKKLIVTVRGLPAKTKVTLKLRAGKSKQTARKRAKKNGKARFKVTLSKRIRKALRDKKVKKLKLKVTAAPPEGGKSSVNLTKSLKG